MEVIPSGVCMICHEYTALLSDNCVTPYLESVQKTFLADNQESFNELKSHGHSSICVLCTHKVVLSRKLKNTFKAVHKRKTPHLACFLCKTRSGDLIDTNYNPNSFIEKIIAFVGRTAKLRSYIDFKICVDCLFHLDVYFEVDCNIRKSITTDSEEQCRAITNMMVKRGPLLNDVSVLTEGKENITPRKKWIFLRKRYPTRGPNSPVPPPTKRLFFSSMQTLTNGKTSPKLSEDEFEDSNDSSTWFGLKRFLRHLEPVRHMEHDTEWPPLITQDKKMFSDIPYIIARKNNKCKARGRPVKYAVERRNRRTVLSMFQRLTRTPFKKPDPILISSDCTDDSDNNTAPPVHTCNICDRTFNTVCDYKAHKLWHEKPEDIVINVQRDDIFARKEKDTELLETELNDLMKKYVSLPDDVVESDTVEEIESASQQINEASDSISAEVCEEDLEREKGSIIEVNSDGEICSEKNIVTDPEIPNIEPDPVVVENINNLDEIENISCNIENKSLEEEKIPDDAIILTNGAADDQNNDDEVCEEVQNVVEPVTETEQVCEEVQNVLEPVTETEPDEDEPQNEEKSVDEHDDDNHVESSETPDEIIEDTIGVLSENDSTSEEEEEDLIEKNLKKIHNEIQPENEETVDDDADSNNINNHNDYEVISDDSLDENGIDKSKSNEDSCAAENDTKRKRMDETTDDNLTDDAVDHKAKRVRFSIDFELDVPVQNEITPDPAFNKDDESNDVHKGEERDE